GQSNLALAYFYTRDFKKAIEEGSRLADRNRKNALYRSNVALYSMYAGQFEDAIRDAAEASKLNQTASIPIVATALSRFAMGKVPEAEDTYRRLDATDKLSAATGLADLALYEGRNGDAAKLLDAQDVPDANRLAMLAVARRKGAPAVDAATKAITASGRAVGPAFFAARVLLENNNDVKAMEIVRDLGARIEPPRRAYGKLIEGEIQLAKGKAQAALDLFQEANKLADTWLGHFDLGRAYLEAGAFTEASSEFDSCEKRKGEATALFFDEVPTFRYFPLVYYYQGRVREGMKRADAPDAYKAFAAIKSKADPGDPLVADAIKRSK